MKKLIIILLALLTISGCSQTISGDAKISQEKEEIYFKYDGKTYTNNDAYQKLKAQNVSSFFDYLIAYKAVEVEGISMDEYIAEIEEQYQTMIDQYGEEMVNMYFGEKDSYINQSILTQAYTQYQTNYAEENIDTLISAYPTINVDYISSTSKTKMNKFLKNVKKSKDFNDAFEKTEFEESEAVVSGVTELNSVDLPNEVLDSFDTLKIGAISKLIEIDNGDDSYTYYVVRVNGRDVKNEYQDDFINYVIQKGYIPTPTEIASAKHEIVMYDDDFNNAYKTLLPETESEE